MALAPWTGLPWSWLPSRKSSSLSSIQRQYPQVSNTVHSLTHYPIALPSITRSECQRRKGRYKAGLTGSKPAPKGPLGRSRSPEVQLDFWSPKNPEFWLSLPLLSLSLIDLHQFTQLWIHLFPTSKSEKVLDKVTSSEDALTSETKTPISMNREGCHMLDWSDSRRQGSLLSQRLLSLKPFITPLFPRPPPPQHKCKVAIFG